MVNHWLNDATDKTACEEYAGENARAISVDHWDFVSCNDCLDADYPAISAGDIELRDFGWIDDDPNNMGRRRCMIYRPRTISTACDQCRRSDVYCQSLGGLCCPGCTH